MSRCFVGLIAAGLIVGLTGFASAEQGLPSESMLSAMGLAGMQVMSDEDALAIRGFGYDPWHGYGKNAKKPMATAYGHSYASISGHGANAYSEDGFHTKGKHKTGGKHKSHASLIVQKVPHHGGGWGQESRGSHGGGHAPRAKQVTVFAGGFSHASTH